VPYVLAILLALAAAAGYGGSDFAAGLASRRASVIRVTLMSETVSVAVVGLALALTGAHPPSLRAVAWGGVAGLAGMTGALALYIGFRHAAFSVAGPLSAVGAAGFSVLAGLLLGERPADRHAPRRLVGHRRRRGRWRHLPAGNPGRRRGITGQPLERLNVS
jgi:drug/metabolite transporter (DMT)-like permease